MANETLVQAVHLTHAIEAAVQEGDWQCAADLVSQRSPLLMTLQPEQPPQALDMIREIQAVDARITARTKAGFEALSKENSEAMRRIKSTNQYLTIGMQR